MNSDDWIETWKAQRRAETPKPADDFTHRVLGRIDSLPPQTLTPLLWICRLALIVLATILMAGRLVATAAVFFASTPLQ